MAPQSKLRDSKSGFKLGGQILMPKFKSNKFSSKYVQHKTCSKHNEMWKFGTEIFAAKNSAGWVEGGGEESNSCYMTSDVCAASRQAQPKTAGK